MTAPAPAAEPAPLRTILTPVAAGAIDELTPVWTLPPPDLINALYEVLPPLLDKWTLAASSAGATWYDQVREANAIKGRFEAIVRPLENTGAKELAGFGSRSLSTSKVNQTQAIVNLDAQPVQALAGEPGEAAFVNTARYDVEGGLQKRIANAANLTITNAVVDDPQARGWMRRTRPNACGFCLLVASRGGVFTKATATFACHSNCYCTAVPAWGGQELPVNPYKPSAKKSTPTDRARVRKWIRDNIQSS